MRSILRLGLVGLAIALVGCEEGANPAAPEESQELTFDPAFDMTGPPDGGTCPDVFYETTEELDNGVMLTWSSALGGFDYMIGTDYTGVVTWSVDEGTAEYVNFITRTPNPQGKRNTWTPRGNDPVDGLMTPGTVGDGSVDVVVNMFEMHQGNEDVDGDGTDDWQGQIGNGHFWLLLDVDDGEGNVESVKLGVNFHLEDPDDGFDDRCPTS
jgi:hypothetical protein